MDIHQEINRLIEREGGFVHDPNDRGGATQYGITQHTLTLWTGRQASADDVRKLDKRTAREIYYSWYYIKPGINELPMLLQPVMLDTCVNMGQKRAIKMLQDALICHGHDCGKIDGRIGTKTIASAFAAVEHMGDALVKSLVRRRVIAYENMVKADDTQRRFLSGWVARAESFLTAQARVT